MATRTDEGWELENGDLIYNPDDEGAIQVRDLDGNSLGLYHVDEPEWVDFARYFNLTAEDFPYCDDCTTYHRTDEHLN